MSIKVTDPDSIYVWNHVCNISKKKLFKKVFLKLLSMYHTVCRVDITKVKKREEKTVVAHIFCHLAA